MKRLYTFCLLLAALLMPWMASADSVNQEQALAKAVQFFQQHPQTRTAPGFELIWDGESAATRATAEPAFFIFNRTDAPGFVIIAGDDSVSPVIGYSFENGFGKGEMPSNLRYWLEGVREMILAARAAGQPAVEQTPKLGEAVKWYDTADWDQSAPYNAECPTYGGIRTVTGCVATAAAIICKYNRWPTAGTGSTPAYVTRELKISVPGRTLGTPYNYDLMPNTYTSGSYTEAEGAEVARLMADLGAAVEADYRPSSKGGTGAYTPDQLYAMTHYMGYNKAARLVLRNGYSDDEWKEIVKAELNAGRPVLYSASGNAGGHAFVLDGYTNDDMYCFNWGWSGSANGAYSINSMNAGGYNFTQDHEVLVDLWPDKEGATTTHSDNLLIGAKEGWPGLSASTKIFTMNTPFTVRLIYYNLSATHYTGRIAIAMVDKHDVVQELVTAEESVSINASSNGSIYLGYLEKTAKITKSIKPGYSLVPVFWDRAKNDWMRMRKYTPEAVDKIVLMEANPDGDAIASGTQISYNRATKEVSIMSYNGATFELLKANGSKVQSQTVGNDPIVLKNLASGSYTVRIYFDADEPCEFKLTL